MTLDERSSSNIAAEPAYCPACDFKHVRQPDWLCPRCGMPVETAAWRSAVGGRAVEEAPEAPFPVGSVLAGAILALTGVVLAIGFARDPVFERRWPLVVVTAILLVLGIELLLKVTPARWVAALVAAIVLLVAAEALLRARAPDLMGDPLPPGLRVALQGLIGALSPLRLAAGGGLLGGTMLLVAGRPGKGRIAAGALVAVPLAVLEVIRWFVP